MVRRLIMLHPVGLSGTTNWDETPAQTQNTQEGLPILSGLGVSISMKMEVEASSREANKDEEESLSHYLKEERKRGEIFRLLVHINITLPLTSW